KSRSLAAHLTVERIGRLAISEKRAQGEDEGAFTGPMLLDDEDWRASLRGRPRRRGGRGGREPPANRRNLDPQRYHLPAINSNLEDFKTCYAIPFLRSHFL